MVTDPHVEPVPEENQPEQPVDDKSVKGNGQDLDASPAPKKKNRFSNFEKDLVGPEDWVRPEPETTYVIGFGDPAPGEWFRIDPRPERTKVLMFVKARMPDAKGRARDTRFYVEAEARDLPEIREKIRPHAVHVVVDVFGHRSLWARRLPRPSRNFRDTWAVSDAGVAEEAKKEWVRREIDETVSEGARKSVKVPQGETPPKDPVWDDEPFDELLDKAIPAANIISDATHPLIVYRRSGRLVEFTTDDE